MPSLRDSAIPIGDSYARVATNTPITQQPGPVHPAHLTPSPVMISSLPSISTGVEGITRQFYGRRNLPQRRLVLPKA